MIKLANYDAESQVTQPIKNIDNLKISEIQLINFLSYANIIKDVKDIKDSVNNLQLPVNDQLFKQIRKFYQNLIEGVYHPIESDTDQTIKLLSDIDEILNQTYDQRNFFSLNDYIDQLSVEIDLSEGQLFDENELDAFLELIEIIRKQVNYMNRHMFDTSLLTLIIRK